MDWGGEEDVILLAGMGRSGTTWLSGLLNYEERRRVLFEPFARDMVLQAQPFERIPYISPEEYRPELASLARKILAGRVYGRWVDRDNSSWGYTERIVKTIRANMMLAWLKVQVPSMPIVWLVRHPLAIAWSWTQLGWSVYGTQKGGDVEFILGYKKLLRDYPEIERVARTLNLKDSLERSIFLWGVYHLLPSQELEKGHYCLVYYENLMRNPEAELKRIFDYLGLPQEGVKKALSKRNDASSTNFHQRNIEEEQGKLVQNWKVQYTKGEIERARHIVQAFGLGHFYEDW